jgi:beta-N-acetylhexosaminidase
MLGFNGTTADAAAPLIRQYAPGAIVFWQNTTGPAQTAALTSGLQGLARTAGIGLPLFIAIDQEGGEVQRLRSGVAYFPSKLVLGATDSPELARLEGEVEGRELRALGINMNLSPVLDVDDNPANPIIGAYERSLGSDPARVSALGVAYVEGLQGQGVVAVAKHFPGHGSTGQDSHVALPTLDHDRARLERLELPPFRAVLPSVGAVMSAHVLFPALDPSWPASLSPVFLTRLLRDELSYDGLVMTDDTGAMAAITANYAPGPASVQAIAAGSDLVMVVGDANRQAQAYEALLDAARRNALTPQRIDASVRRILRAKAAYGVLDAPAVSSQPNVGTREHLAAVQQVAEAAITLVRNEGSQVPLAPNAGGRALVISPGVLPPGSGGTLLGQQVRSRLPRSSERVFSLSADNGAVLEQALAAAPGADLVVIGTSNAGPWQQGLLRRLRQQGVRPGVVGFGRPFELRELPADVTYVAAYAPRAELVEAAVKVLFGEIPARGKLPLEIPGLFPAGWHAAPGAEGGRAL